MRKRSGRPPRFAAVPNETVDDAFSFDLEGLGLLTVVLRHRDGYEITLAEIAEKYGYGRDGLAGAWGMLQVARYVIKVKIQWAGDNQWSTEVVVYDTPATDDEVKELLASIAREPGVRTVKLEPPTKSAQERAAKHMAKVEAKRKKANPERRKLDYEVPGQSAGESGRGRGRRDGGEGRGSGGAGAAPAPAKPPRKGTAPKKPTKKKEPGRRLTPQEAAAVKQVEAAFPQELQLPSYRPPVLRDAILDALSARPPKVLVERVKRRWWMHGYEEAVMPGGKGIGSAIGVAVALVRPSTDCPDPMCEDGVVLDTGVKCRTCEQRKEDRKRPVPAQRGGESGEDQGDGAPAARRWKCRECKTLGKTGTEAPEDGLCGPCRKEAQEAEAAAARLREDMARAEAQREELAHERWVELVEDAYREHADREQAAAEERERHEAEEERKRLDAEERRRIQEQIARENPELLAYSQTA
ncbi:hypothetical protein TPA0906_00070 [Streptomyces olivaceus]|uniref:hypothetical protein n=1 Tax=Streptomyces olivaceus TaxID=47716 RepID=UPI0022EDE514|nr:hypothetical protein [Streptomyces olivaceus]GHI98141.1 hypothetical protein TPA0906_00070 [Streptomyces olivaceus]